MDDSDRPDIAPESKQERDDFRLLLALFVFFRLGVVLFLRPGGYIRDYTDLIIYQQRASWQEYGLLPFRDYWSEYPPIFPWLSVLIDRLATHFPIWEDERLWFAALFGILMVAAETVTFVCIYRLARRTQPTYALRVAWMYALLFLPVYLLGGWFDGLAVMTIFGALVLLLRRRTLANALLFGLIVGLGGLIKIVPLAVLAVAPLAYARWRERIAAVGIAIATFAGGYALMAAIGPEMTGASIRSLLGRSGWSTVYALVSGFNRLGKVVGDPFDAAADVALYEPRIPHTWVLAFFGAIGLGMLVASWRRRKPPQPMDLLIPFAGLTYAILLLAYPAWNPQYALYLLPFIVLVLPNGRGLFYALSLTGLVLWEHPVHFNMVDTGYPTAAKLLIDVNYRQMLQPIVLTRTLVLLAVAIDFGMMLFEQRGRIRLVPLAVTASALLIALLALPRYAQTYEAARLAVSDVRRLAYYVNSLPEDTVVVSQQAGLSRELRPFLKDSRRAITAGGRPGRLDPLPELIEAGPFVYIHTGEDDPAILNYLDESEVCLDRRQFQVSSVWYCNGGAPQPIADFGDNLSLTSVGLPNRLDDDNRFALFWETPTGDVEADYTVFLHVVDTDGRLVGQWDQPPGGIDNPTSAWPPNTIFFDDYRVPVAVDGTPPYRVLVGLYDPQTGERLSVIESEALNGGDYVELKTYPTVGRR